MTNMPGGTPFGDEIAEATCHPAKDYQELDQIGRGFMKYMIRLIVSLITSNARVRSHLFDAVTRHYKFPTMVVDAARAGLAEELSARNTVVYEVDASNIRFVPRYKSYRTAVGSSRIAMLIGAILGLLAGILAMTMINATPVAVNVAHQTASVGVSSAVDQPWFIGVFLVITTVVGYCIGSVKQRYDTIEYVAGVRAAYVDDTEEECEESEER